MALINSPASGVGAPKASPQRHYETLSVSEICKMIPPSEDKAHLYLWVLNQHIDWGYEVARAWGFEPLQMLTWCKPGMGAGRFQCNSEQILVCRKGNRAGNPFAMTGGTWFQWPRGVHSEKPEEFYQLVERCSPGPYLEMFSRKTREGWAAFGNEVGKLNGGVTRDCRSCADCVVGEVCFCNLYQQNIPSEYIKDGCDLHKVII